MVMVTYYLEAQAMIDYTVRMQEMLYLEVQAMTFYTEVMEVTKPTNNTEKMEMMKSGPPEMDQTIYLVVMVMT